MLNKSHPFSWYKTNRGKSKKKKYLIHFDPDARIFVLSNWHNFSVIVWTNKLHDFDEGTRFPDNCYYENGLKTFLQWS